MYEVPNEIMDVLKAEIAEYRDFDGIDTDERALYCYIRTHVKVGFVCRSEGDHAWLRELCDRLIASGIKKTVATDFLKYYILKLNDFYLNKIDPQEYKMNKIDCAGNIIGNEDPSL